MLNVYSKNIFVRIAFTMLSVVLCLVLIFNAGIVDCFAFAVTGGALFWLIVAILGACGITFATHEQAQTGATTFYKNCDTVTQNALNSKAETLSDFKPSEAGLIVTAVVAFGQFVWKGIVEAIHKTFGNYTSVDVAFDLSSDVSNIDFSNKFYYLYEVDCNGFNSITYQINNCKIAWYGARTETEKPYMWSELMGNDTTGGLQVASIGLFDFVLRLRESNSDYPGWLDTSSAYNTIAWDCTESDDSFEIGYMNLLSLTSAIYFNGQRISYDFPGGGSLPEFTLSFSDGQNIVSDGYFVGTNIATDSICPDGVWTYQQFYNYLCDIGLRVPAVTGNPGIDVNYYPGNDVWHDGLVGDGDIGNDTIGIGVGDIGISVPLTDSLVTDYSAEQARDIANSDIVDKTLTDTRVDTSINYPVSTPANTLPTLTLPEILFKEKFPFCLPWDVYNLFAGLQFENAEAPCFTIPFKFERLGIDEEIVIDFEDFEEPVKIIRFFIGATFVLALVLVSRKLIGS